MDNRIFGYARVSSADQNLGRQLDALARFPVQRSQIYADKASGKDFKRPQYQRLLRRLREGDVLVIKSIDRLGRNYREVLDEWRRITVDRNAAIVVLDMPLLDTREQPDGIASARLRGVKFGRPAFERPDSYRDVIKLFEGGEVTRREAAALLNVSVSTFDRWRRADATSFDRLSSARPL